MSAAPLYLQEFPDFGELDVTLPEGFVDESWHNNMCPSFARDLPNGNRLLIWIAEASREAREWPDMPRFGVALYGPFMDQLDGEFMSDDWSAVCAEVERVTAANQSYPAAPVHEAERGLLRDIAEPGPYDARKA